MIKQTQKGELLQGHSVSFIRARPQPRTRWLNRSPVRFGLVFLATFAILFLGMDRGFDFYDEGLILVGAMRVAAGQVPHRDFYANYGPAQFYTLAWLFHWFGPSIWVERIYDLAVRSAIVTFVYGFVASYCRQGLAISTAVVCGLWLFSAGLPTIAYPILPLILLSLAGSSLLLPIFSADLPPWRALLAGSITGVSVLFRYDVGAAMVVVHLTSIAVAELRRRRALPFSTLTLYTLGMTGVFLPPALVYLAIAPVHSFVHDIFLYPVKYYARARHLPLPGIRWRSLENLAMYLPPLAALPGLYVGGTERQSNQEKKGILILFGLLEAIFYLKGIVRISVVQMLLSLVPTVIVIAVLLDVTAKRGGRLHTVAQCLMGVSIFTATWSGLKEVRVLYLNRQSVLQELLSPSQPCTLGKRLDTGICFYMDRAHEQVTAYLVAHTQPSERIFIGLDRHDRLVSNDLLTYFLSARMPATHWSHFDPDLQTRTDIQMQMIQELEHQDVRYVVLESQYNAVLEQWNDSSRSSGVRVLDDYIRVHYSQVAQFGPISIWLRNGATP
jgi:hypothetical protein